MAENITLTQASETRIVVRKDGKPIGFLMKRAHGDWFAGGGILYGLMQEHCRAKFFNKGENVAPCFSTATYEEVRDEAVAAIRAAC